MRWPTAKVRVRCCGGRELRQRGNGESCGSACGRCASRSANAPWRFLLLRFCFQSWFCATARRIAMHEQRGRQVAHVAVLAVEISFAESKEQFLQWQGFSDQLLPVFNGISRCRPGAE